MKTQPHVFATFPEFSRLTLADREKYGRLIEDYPPISEISFPTLANWWETLGDCAVSQINGNLAISYWMPEDEKNSGLAVVGTRRIDESIATVIDWLHAQEKPARLIRVPEFTVSSMRFPELYTFTDERNFDECILSVARLGSLEHINQYKRSKVRRFLTEIDEARIAVEDLDLSSDENRQMLCTLVDSWQHKNTFNGIGITERKAAKRAIMNAETLGIDNVCLYIDGRLHAFLLYHYTYDPRYVIVKTARISYEIPQIFELSMFKFAQWFTKKGVIYANAGLDFGLPYLRTAKLSLGPTNFWRKYTVTPIN